MQQAKDIFERQTRCAWIHTLSPETRRELLEAMHAGPSPRRCFAAALNAVVLAVVLLGLGLLTAFVLIL